MLNLPFLNQKSPYCSLIGGFCTGEALFSNAVCLKRECLWPAAACSSPAPRIPGFGEVWSSGDKEQKSSNSFLSCYVFPSKTHLRYRCIRP